MQGNANSAGTGADVPMGLGLLMMEDEVALSRFGSMSPEEKRRVLHYVESSTDGEDAKRRIAYTVKCLHDGIPEFYLH